MKEWKAKAVNNERDYIEISGNTLQQACDDYAHELVRWSKNRSSNLLEIMGPAELEYSDGPFGEKGGVIAKYNCRMSSYYDKNSKDYREYNEIVKAMIKASKNDVEAKDTAESIKELRERTGLTQVDFSKQYNIPVGSIRDWEQGRKHCPEYVIELLRFKIEHE